jgi:hypothetical protein
MELTHQVTGVNIDGTAFTAYSSGGDIGKVYEIVSPYAAADTYDITFSQKADTMYLSHPDYPVYELTRTDHDAWTISEMAFGPVIDTPADITVTVNTAGTESRKYRVTAIDRYTQEESLPGLEDTEAVITGITQANPGVVTTSAAHNYSDGDEVQLDNVVGMTEVNAIRYIVANKAATTFELTDVDGNNVDTTGFTAYSSAGIARRTFVLKTTSAVSEDNTIAWTAISSARLYAVYREENGLYGLIGETEVASFTDSAFDADYTIQPPQLRNPFDEASDYPSATGFYEQRLAFGGTTNEPETIHFSQIGRFENFNRNLPTQDDDAIEAELASQEVNQIRHFVGLNDLIVFTSNQEWRVSAGADGAFTSDTLRAKPQSQWGCSVIRPVVLNNTVLFVTDGDAGLRSLGYSFALDGYTGGDLALLSRHFLEGYTILDACAQQFPDGRVYMPRSDGKLLTMAYDQDQEVSAWTSWETDGDFLTCAKLAHEGPDQQDITYTVVKRLIDGNNVYMIEYFYDRFFDDVRDCFFVDSGLSEDDPIAISAITLQSIEDSSDIDTTAFNAYVSGGNVRLAFTTFRGLDHLEGKSLVALCDGDVVRSLTVTNGAITLPRSYSRVHAGLPYVANIETLPLERGDGTMQGLRARINKLTMRFYKSRGMFYGPSASQLFEMKQREYEAVGEPTNLLTGDKEVIMDPKWQMDGCKIFLQHTDPLPMTLLALIPDLDIGDN